MTDQSEPEMVERVARALEEVYASATDRKVDTWDAYARAAIEAMREPTEGMVRAAHASMVRENCGLEYSVTVGHRAMIDAALSGSRTPE